MLQCRISINWYPHIHDPWCLRQKSKLYAREKTVCHTHRISVVKVDCESKRTRAESLIWDEAVLECGFSLWLNSLLVGECSELYKNHKLTWVHSTHSHQPHTRKHFLDQELSPYRYSSSSSSCWGKLLQKRLRCHCFKSGMQSGS